ncbi:Cytochrome c oxidase copper chaperone [Bulinus truncatus]|nr:Cytochrome c oxidase copper chaperone [Bulinus truncatus]
MLNEESRFDIVICWHFFLFKIKIRMSAQNTPLTSSDLNATPQEKPKCKACCACPETKKARDECVIQKGEENCEIFLPVMKWEIIESKYCALRMNVVTCCVSDVVADDLNALVF